MRIVHYINQFFAGIGAEDKASMPLEFHDQAIGPGKLLESAFGGQGKIDLTIVCGDNYFADKEEDVIKEVLAKVKSIKPDLFVAGPAFNAGRYGIACGALCQAVSQRLKIPTITGMYPENPGVPLYRKFTIIIPTGEIASSMKAAMNEIARIGVKVSKGEPLGPAATEGYIPQGHRDNMFLEKPAADRAIDMLVAKLNNRPFLTELKMEGYEKIPAAPPITDLSKARIAIVTKSGVVPLGNPDHLEWARGSKWLKYSIKGVDDLTNETHQAIHGGFDNTWTNEDPDRMLGVDVLRQLEREGFIGSLHDMYYVTMGNGGDLNHMRRFGKEMAHELKALGIHGVISPAT